MPFMKPGWEPPIVKQTPSKIILPGSGLGAVRFDQQVEDFSENSIRANYPLEDFFSPMRAAKTKDQTKMAKLWVSDQYVCDEKEDGHRAYTIGNRCFPKDLSDATGLPVEKTKHIPHIMQSFDKWPLLMLDAESFLPGRKSEDVQEILGCGWEEAIQRQEERNDYIHFKVFDIIRLPDGTWLLDTPWHKRRKLLEDFYQNYLTLADKKYIRLAEVIHENKFEYCQQIWKDGGEGVVLKNIDGIYAPGKRPMWNWMKAKQEFEDDVIILGFLPPERLYTEKNYDTWQYWEVTLVNGRKYIHVGHNPGDAEPVTKYYAKGWIGSIVVGKYASGAKAQTSSIIGVYNLNPYQRNGTSWYPIEVGSVSGMKEKAREEFSKNPEQYIGKVIEIGFMEPTEAGAYRHPKFKRMRPDKSAKECRIE